MAEVLGIASGIAGLVSLCDTIVRLGYKYIRDVKDAEKSVQSLVDEVNNLAGVLHSLNNVVQELEVADSTTYGSSKIQHINSCQKTLEKINRQLESAIPEVKTFSQRLKLPLKKGTIAELLKEIQSYKSTMTMAMQARQMRVISARSYTDLQGKLDLLGTIDVWKWQNSNVRIRQPGTGVWFTESKEFQSWASADNSKLWVHGIPGAGKTILVASIIQEIEQTYDSSHGLAIFFCDYKDTQTHDPRIILGALARQLIQIQPKQAFTQLKTFCAKHQMTQHTQGSATTEDLCEFIVELSKNFTSTSIIVDGLDEVVEDRAEVTRLLQSLNKPSGTIKTLFASRNEVDIQRVLVDYPSISIAARSGDLRLYVHSEIENRTKMGKLRIRDRSLKDHIIKVLTEGADGISDGDRRDALKQLPPDLPKSYDRVLERVNRSSKENQALVKHTLLWIVYAETPLKIKQLLQALALRPGKKVFEYEYMPTLDELLNWCSSLVRRDYQLDSVELAHFTVKEYLLSLDGSCNSIFSQYRLSGDHTDIARTCLRFLGLSEFDGLLTTIALLTTRPADFIEAWEEFEKNYPFMIYVFRNWVKHVNRSSSAEVVDEVLLLLDESSATYALWTFGTCYYRCYQDYCKETWRYLKDKVLGPSRPSALHWAAMLALPDVFTTLLGSGEDVNTPSVAGAPVYCAMMGIEAILDFSENIEVDPLWNWDARRKIIRILLMAGVDLNNIHHLHGCSLSVIDLVYREWGAFNEVFQSLLDMNPSISLSILYSFLEFVGVVIRDDSDEPILDNPLIFELLQWGVQTDFKHFAPDTLPVVFSIMLYGLAKSKGPTKNIKYLFEFGLNKVALGNDGMTSSCVSQRQSEDWETKFSIAILQAIYNSQERAPHSLENALAEIVEMRKPKHSDPLLFERLQVPALVLEIISTLYVNGIKIDLNWPCTNESGNTILHHSIQTSLSQNDSRRHDRPVWLPDQSDYLQSLLYKAVSEQGADLTVPNNNSMTLIELLVQNWDCHMSGFRRIWESANISSAFTRLPDLPEKLLHAATTNCVQMVEFIFDQLAKDEDTHTELLQEFVAHHCTIDYMQKLFRIRFKRKIIEHTDSKEEALSPMELSEQAHSLVIFEGKRTDLHLLIGSHKPSDFGKLRILLTKNPDLQVQNGQGFTPLATAIQFTNIRAMYALLIAGADIETCSSRARTCLHLACCLRNAEAVKTLLRAGADTSIKDNCGYTAENLAVRTQFSEIIDLFTRARDDKSGTESSGGEIFEGSSVAEGSEAGSSLMRRVLLQILRLRMRSTFILPSIRQTPRPIPFVIDQHDP
ncbi:hypothetical protein SBOR_5298 [Sclerotinia borealis F-4128]|uniref:Uncharacterized protein n=1 Tax=Sclerotinia borealis (strain F-4128) TaxID=1432307 RepID=W9CC41_SCLBF|nr:hypothetical protein SBOR_5298 [Sclerotinia borealis F-4128]